MRFVGWENEVESKFDSLEDMIEDTINSLNFNVNRLLFIINLSHLQKFDHEILKT